MSEHGYMPDPQQDMLLRALLDRDAERAENAARTWTATTDFDHIDEASWRLMPLLDWRMGAFQIDHPNRGRIRGLRRRSWYMTQLDRRRFEHILEWLSPIEEPILALKGIALGAYAYPASELRPFSDFDIFLRAAAMPKAVAILQAQGYRVHLTSINSVTLTADGQREVDVHSSPFFDAFAGRYVEPMMARRRWIPAEPSASGSKGFYGLGDVDQLLHTFVHGLRPNAVSPIRWIVDAAMILDHAGERFDWDLFVAEAVRLQFREPAILGLNTLLGYRDVPGARAAVARLGVQVSDRSLKRFDRRVRTEGPMVIWEATRRNAAGPARVGMFLSYYRKAFRGAPITRIARRVIIRLGIMLRSALSPAR